MSRKPREATAFGVSIREARRQRGWTQAQLAQRAGVSRPTVARVETGSNISTSTLEKVAKALGLSMQLGAGPDDAAISTSRGQRSSRGSISPRGRP